MMMLIFLLLQLFVVYALAETDTSASCLSTSLCAVPDPLQFKHCFHTIYVFGDSLEDTGNLATLNPQSAPRYPYGITWPGCPKGRFSDGRLFVDFYAMAFGVKLTRPFAACECGTNFAIAGATALSVAEFQEMNLTTIVPYSLQDELEWFNSYKENCLKGKLDGNALYTLQIGANDYTVAALAGLTPSEIIETYVDRVVERNIQATQMLIEWGAKRILVENVPQTSCTPLYLTIFQDRDRIDKFGCLMDYGRIVRAHNAKLQEALFTRLELPKDVILAIEDSYGVFFEIWNNPERYGIDNPRVACCGGGGPYNANVSAFCGFPGATVCKNPNRSFYWDEVHFTDHYNHVATSEFLAGRFLIAVTKGSIFCRHK